MSYYKYPETVTYLACLINSMETRMLGREYVGEKIIGDNTPGMEGDQIL